MKVTQYPRKLHALGAISARGTVGSLSFANTWNAATFTDGFIFDILREAQIWYPGVGWRLQLDNATPHTAVATAATLETHGVPELLFQPPHSPDLNPIENVWTVMKKRLESETFNNLAGLRRAVKDIWQSFTVSDLENITSSMPDRIEEVLAGDGGHTHY